MEISIVSGSALMVPGRRDEQSPDPHFKAAGVSQQSSGDRRPGGSPVRLRIIRANDVTDIRTRRGLEHIRIARALRCSREAGKESSRRRIQKIMPSTPPGSLRDVPFAPPFSCARRSTLLADSAFRVA